MQWTMTYPGLPSMVPAIRAWVRAMLTCSPRRDDAELVIAELVANSLRHTPSGQPGGEVTVTVTVRDGWARVTVADSGPGDWERPDLTPDELEVYGRGLLIVDVVADKVGHDVSQDGQVMWAEFEWRPTDG
ncbi:hypothetical protein GCM10009678_30490 [Actinomadura kijaniata]|uniref:Anti-sigma regulatory factor (Ser/Thr protein kinase) n=1 Tax=Actinomadura namibiensis TaxID=182080 RepID=A0A7W3QLX9_ACTNM|nr:ATP-binding protein [Actinomadura namibiensis]MBA8951985.1 anti-sigma regulatory factor (Ser/Thr protein kinase) [Actinomadura namibiensis]